MKRTQFPPFSSLDKLKKAVAQPVLFILDMKIHRAQRRSACRVEGVQPDFQRCRAFARVDGIFVAAMAVLMGLVLLPLHPRNQMSAGGAQVATNLGLPVIEGIYYATNRIVIP